MTTLYYDPTVDVHHRLPVNLALTTSFYAAPQQPDDARRLFEAGCAALGISDSMALPVRASRNYGSSLILAREWGMDDLADLLVKAIEASYEPTWDHDSNEFTWGMGLDEQHPRGQYNAFLAAAEASGPGRWEQLSAAPLASCPQIVDVDFPTMALSRAEWVGDALHLSLAPQHEDPKKWTSFRIAGAEPRLWFLEGLEGATMDTQGSSVIVRVPLVKADLVFMPGIY